MSMKLTATAAAITLTLSSGAALAQDVGATIAGNDGNAVGTVASNDGATIVVDTGKHQVPLGPEAFAQGESGWSLNTTKTDLDAAYDALLEEQAAALAAALVVGAPVVTIDAQPFGAIEEIKEDAIILADGEAKVELPKDFFALDADGGVMVLANHADIMAAINTAG